MHIHKLEQWQHGHNFFVHREQNEKNTQKGNGVDGGHYGRRDCRRGCFRFDVADHLPRYHQTPSGKDPVRFGPVIVTIPMPEDTQIE
jgi:hypothetical protein